MMRPIEWVDLQVAIRRSPSTRPKPFTGTKTPGQILTELNPLNAPVHQGGRNLPATVRS
jgi:hypothetical protein